MKISDGNMKLGKIPNFSMPPGVSCSDTARATCHKICYARKAYRMYWQTRAAWTENYLEMAQDQGKTLYKVHEWIQKKQPRLFRIHVAGDFLSYVNLVGWVDLAYLNPATKFLAFTKRYEWAVELHDNYRIPANFVLVLSAWPEVELPRGKFPIAWMRDKAGKETRIPDNAFHCPGNCSTCGATCWNATVTGGDIVFNEH